MTPSDLLGGDVGYKSPLIIPIIKEWTQSGYDIRERVVINVDYDLPVRRRQVIVNHPGIST